MAVALRNAAAWVAGSTSVALTLPASVASGDMMVAFIGCKPFSATIVTPAGWTPVPGTAGNNGSTASGTDVGSVLWVAFYREFQTGVTAPTVTVTSGNVALGFIIAFSKAATKSWSIAGAKGSDTSSGTAFSLTMDANPGLAAGDYVCSPSVLPGDNATFGTPTLTATGASMGAVTELPATEGTTITGNDLEASNCYAAVASGASSAAPVVGWTLSVAQTGGGCIVRFREIDYPTPDILLSRSHRPRQAVTRAAVR